MSHPTEVQQAWDDLTPFPQPVQPTDYPTVDDLVAAVRSAEDAELSEPMRDVAQMFTERGFQVHVIDGVIYADVVTVDPDTNEADCQLSVRVSRED